MTRPVWDSTTGPPSVRADFLLSPLFVLSLAALLVNDLYLKQNHPGVVSGLLSDVAGMVFFPLFFVGLAELGARLVPKRPFARPSWFVISALVTGVLFVTFKYTITGEEMYIYVTEPLRSTFGALIGYQQRGLVADPLDLVALLMIPIPMIEGRRWRGRGPS